jgi:hypothetical protein
VAAVVPTAKGVQAAETKPGYIPRSLTDSPVRACESVRRR